MTADQALAIIAADYDMGEGGGQLSKLIDDVMRLRGQGFRPSAANRLAIEQALEHRPNQAPLVEALKATLSYQRKLQAQAQMSSKRRRPSSVRPRAPHPVPLPHHLSASPGRAPASSCRSASLPLCSTKNC